MRYDSNTVTSSAEPLVSVIMPAFNCERYVETAVRSVICQTHKNLELFVIDDGSSDATVAKVEALAEGDSRIRLIRNAENMGAAGTRNRGLELCSGDFVAFIDSDDLWHRDKLAAQIDLMEREGADLCYTSYAIIDSIGNEAKPPYKVPETVDFDGLLRENVIGCSTVMLKGETAREKRFKTDFYHEDYCLWLDILREGKRAAGCTRILADWRYIESSRSFDKRNSALNRWRIYRDHLKLPFIRSAAAFASYALRGLKKYYSK